MAKEIDHGKVVQQHSGKGEITFPRGGRIRSYFVLTEYESGKRTLVCTGRFMKSGYEGWEQLVSHYQLEPRVPQAKQAWRAARYEGQNDDGQQLIIEQMFLISGRSSDAGAENLTLEMQFDCVDATLTPVVEAGAETRN